MPEECASQQEAEEVADCYRDEGLVSGTHRHYDRLRIVPPPGVKRQRRRSAEEANRDATLARFAADRQQAVDRLPELRAHGVAPAGCGHPQDPPTDAEVAACPELLIRVCATCQQLLCWLGEEWTLVPRA